MVAQSVAIRGREGGATAELGGEISGALRASQGGGDKPHVLTSAVRRLTPRECERLMGFQFSCSPDYPELGKMTLDAGGRRTTPPYHGVENQPNNAPTDHGIKRLEIRGPCQNSHG